MILDDDNGTAPDPSLSSNSLRWSLFLQTIFRKLGRRLLDANYVCRPSVALFRYFGRRKNAIENGDLKSVDRTFSSLLHYSLGAFSVKPPIIEDHSKTN
jgi:hypothetical protein